MLSWTMGVAFCCLIASSTAINRRSGGSILINVQFLPTTCEKCLESFCLLQLDLVNLLLDTIRSDALFPSCGRPVGAVLFNIYSLATHQPAAGSIHAVVDHGGPLLLLVDIPCVS
jgi:hypothetical protein